MLTRRGTRMITLSLAAFLFPADSAEADGRDANLTPEQIRILDGVKKVRILTEKSFREVDETDKVPLDFPECVRVAFLASGFHVATDGTAEATVRIRILGTPRAVKDAGGRRYWLEADVEGSITIEVQDFQRTVELRGSHEYKSDLIRSSAAPWPKDAPFDDALCNGGALKQFAGLLEALWGSDRATVYASLFDGYMHEMPWRMHAASLLAEMGAPATKALKAALDRTIHVYGVQEVYLVRVLCKIGGAEAFSAVAAAARDEAAERFVRKSCIEELSRAHSEGRLVPADFRAILLDLMGSKDYWDVRSEALRLLGTLRDPLAVEPLIDVFEKRMVEPVNESSDDRSVRSSEIEAVLGALKAITGAEIGRDAGKWRTWWAENRNKLPQKK